MAKEKNQPVETASKFIPGEAADISDVEVLYPKDFTKTAANARRLAEIMISGRFAAYRQEFVLRAWNVIGFGLGTGLGVPSSAIGSDPFTVDTCVKALQELGARSDSTNVVGAVPIPWDLIVSVLMRLILEKLS